jgi:hypothetical protein
MDAVLTIAYVSATAEATSPFMSKTADTTGVVAPLHLRIPALIFSAHQVIHLNIPSGNLDASILAPLVTTDLKEFILAQKRMHFFMSDIFIHCRLLQSFMDNPPRMISSQSLTHKDNCISLVREEGGKLDTDLLLKAQVISNGRAENPLNMQIKNTNIHSQLQLRQQMRMDPCKNNNNKKIKAGT